MKTISLLHIIANTLKISLIVEPHVRFISSYQILFSLDINLSQII